MSGDRRAALAAVLVFSFALGTGTLALPLLALAAGYSVAEVGFLAATGAVSQIAVRLALPWLLRRLRDRVLIGVACLLMAACYGTLLLSTGAAVFVAAHLLLGTARALFWTASQTHAVRSVAGGAVTSLAGVAFVANIGNMAGPAVAGVLAGVVSLDAVLVAGAAVAVAGIPIAARLARLPTYERRRGHGGGRLWRRPGVDVACWASFTAGGWRALLSSYVPVVLSVAGLPAATIGWLVGLSDAAGTVASGMLARLGARRPRVVLDAGVAAASAGLAVLPFVASEPALAAVALAVGGAGAIAVTSLGPALASEAVDPAEQGDAIALAGTFRAAALLALPAGVGAALGVLTLSGGMVVAAAALGLPALTRRRIFVTAP